MANYVKFQRGSEQAYNNLAVKNQNTLYFVYNGSDSTTAKLYLGNKLLSGIGEGTGVTSLSALEDVLITGTPPAGSFLVYTDGKWVNKSVSAVASMIAAEQPLGIKINTNQFKFDVATGNLELVGFSDATSGAIAFKGTDGTLSWGTPKIISDISDNLNNLNTNLESIINEKIAAMNHLVYKKVDNLDNAIDNNTIYLVPNENAIAQNSYSEYLVVDGVPELLGNVNTGEINLDGYATVESLTKLETKFNSVVGDITQLNNYNADSPQTIIDELNAINERLKWEDIPV